MLVTLNIHIAIFHSFYSWNHNLVFVQKSNNRISMHGLKSILEKERLSRHLCYRIKSSDPEISRRVSLQIYQGNICRRRWMTRSSHPNNRVGVFSFPILCVIKRDNNCSVVTETTKVFFSSKIWGNSDEKLEFSATDVSPKISLGLKN